MQARRVVKTLSSLTPLSSISYLLPLTSYLLPLNFSLYIHIPFCGGKCDYCDFYSVPVSPDNLDHRLERYVDTLLLEAGRLFTRYRPEEVPTLYIGGGTPSVLGPSLIGRLLDGLLDVISRFSLPPREITVEANPESADVAFLDAVRERKVSRLSLGVQAFHGPSRQAIGRLGDGSLLRERLALAAEYFPGALSVDLIAGLPFQNESILLEDIAELLSFKPSHVSLYALTVEDGTPLGVRAAEGEVNLPQGDEADRLWIAGRDALEESGYEQYEVSNFCLQGRESRHNVRYWRMHNWLALGPSASGTVIDDEAGKGIRYTFPSDLNNWLSPAVENLDTLTLIKETFLMGFRYIEGPDEELFRRRSKRNVGDVIPKTLESWREKGLMRKDKCALTKDGLLLLNRFLIEAYEEVDGKNLSC